MNPERWKRVKALLDQAIALDPVERAPSWIASATSDSELRREVDRSSLPTNRQGLIS